MEKNLSRNWICCGLIGLAVLLLWGPTVTFDFVWDDGLYITQNESIRSLSNIPKFFYRADVQSAERPSVSYRPLRNTVFALLNALGGKPAPQPWIFHLANVLAHATAAILLFLVALLLFERLSDVPGPAARIASLCVALGFAVHPVISEDVCWAKCLDDLMGAVFVLASARSLMKWNGGRRDYIWAVGWFILAAFSKESSLPFALVVFFILRGFHKLPRRQCVKLSIPFLAAAFLYAVCQRCVLGRLSQCPPLSGTYIGTLVDMFPVGPEYLRLLLGIPPFCADYNFMVGAPHHPFFSGTVLVGVALLVFVGGLSAWLWQRRQWRLSSFGLIWAALFLPPVSNLAPMMQFMAERFLYLPLMGFLLALGGVLLNFSRQRSALILTLVVIISWAGTSAARREIWRDDLTFFIGTELEHPGIKRVEKNAVAAIFKLPQISQLRKAETLTPGQAGELIGTLQKARQIYPENDVLTTQLGITELKIGHLKDAVLLLDLASRQNPTSAERWYNLASVYRLNGQTVQASDACARALQLDPQNQDARRLQLLLANGSAR